MKSMKAVAALILCIAMALCAGCSHRAKPSATAQQASDQQIHLPANGFAEKLKRLSSDIDALREALDEAENLLVEIDSMGSPDFAEKETLIQRKAAAMEQLDRYAEMASSFSSDNENELDSFTAQTEEYTALLKLAIDRARAALSGMAASPTDEPAPEIPDDEWTVVTFDYTDGDGYQMTATVKYSRVYPSSMYSCVEALWAVMGRGYTLPTEGSWGFTHYEGGIWSLDCGTLSIESPRHNIFTAANDLYYMVGTVQFENHTPGWSFSDSNPGTPKLYITTESTAYTAFAVGRVFYSNTDKTFDAWIQVSPKMTRDKTTEIPFCLAFVEQYSPNYPNGRYRSFYEQEGFLKIRAGNEMPTPVELRFAEP
ncbi:MAG: hypothetical protein J5772_00645 [Clostridia bacterium]|nr:hypothetical protein [Clostridia bacterium]